MTLTKAHLAGVLVERLGLTKREAGELVDAFFEEIAAALEQGDNVKLTGFGGFRLRDKRQRPGRNPKTREPVPIPARRVVTFHASPKLKDMAQKNPRPQRFVAREGRAVYRGGSASTASTRIQKGNGKE